jgi:hypothetical protein
MLGRLIMHGNNYVFSLILLCEPFNVCTAVSLYWDFYLLGQQFFHQNVYFLLPVFKGKEEKKYKDLSGSVHIPAFSDL